MVLRILVLLSLYYTIVALAVEGGGNSTAESTRGNMTDVGDLLSEEEASNGTSTVAVDNLPDGVSNETIAKLTDGDYSNATVSESPAGNGTADGNDEKGPSEVAASMVDFKDQFLDVINKLKEADEDLDQSDVMAGLVAMQKDFADVSARLLELEPGVKAAIEERKEDEPSEEVKRLEEKLKELETMLETLKERTKSDTDSTSTDPASNETPSNSSSAS